MKGIVLAGGTGTRLFPCTKAVSKQLIPIYDKPMIYYPLSVLMLSDIRDIMIITNPEYIQSFTNLLGDGSDLGLHIEYKMQSQPRGIAESFILAEEFIGEDSVALVLGDNIFYGQGFSDSLNRAKSIINGAKIFGYYVKNPDEYGVIEFDNNYKVLSIEEKPKKPKSNYAIPGLYFYDNQVVCAAKSIQPSSRGELEITAVNEWYLQRGKLQVELLGRGMAWLDTGNCSTLLEASNFVASIQNRQGLYIACLEEIAFRKGFIDYQQVMTLSQKYRGTQYGEYLQQIATLEL